MASVGSHRHHIKEQTDKCNVPPALFVWLILSSAATKIPLEKQVLLASTKQNLSNLLFLDIYRGSSVVNNCHVISRVGGLSHGAVPGIGKYMMEQVACNKSSLLRKIILQNTQTLQLFTIDIKTEIINKSCKKCRCGRLGLRVIEFL